MNQIGIYKITNTVNGHCYIGQSREISKRWKNHKVAAFNPNDKGYEYPLYRAMRKYGVDNFQFEIIECCHIDELNEREKFWIVYYMPVYNQTAGGDYTSVPQKLTPVEVQEIQNILIQDIDGNVSHADLAKRYNVSKDTIRDINVGRTWKIEGVVYPLHYSKYDANKPNKIQYYCCDCGMPISHGATRCVTCENKHKINAKPVSREELKALIRTTPFTTIGKMFGVSDNAIRKWCDSMGLPRKASEIKSFTDEEWLSI